METRKARCPNCCPDVAVRGWTRKGYVWGCDNCGYEAPVVRRETKLIEAYGVKMTPKQAKAIEAILAEASKDYEVREFKVTAMDEKATLVFLVLDIARTLTSIFDIHAHAHIAKGGKITLLLSGSRERVIQPHHIVYADVYEREGRKISG